MRLLDEIEAEPASYPPEPSGVFGPREVADTPMPLDPAVVWSRIEAWVSHRWSSRSVTWIIEGPGDFTPPLTPVNSATTECWDGSAWQAETLDASFMGGWVLPGEGPYRIIADVGGGTVPEVVNQAYRRLHDYFGETPGRRLRTRWDRDLGGKLKKSEDMPEMNLARALAKSGAADLLRSYRRVK